MRLAVSIRVVMVICHNIREIGTDYREEREINKSNLLRQCGYYSSLVRQDVTKPGFNFEVQL